MKGSACTVLDGQWLLTPQRAAVHRPTRTAVVADLHLGYHQSRQCRGEAVPTLTVAEQLAPLKVVMAVTSADRLVIAGDLFESAPDTVLIAELLRWLRDAAVEFAALVPGNHDRGLTGFDLPLHPDGYRLGEWTVVHGDRRLPEGAVVQGHVHPCFRIGPLGGPCYLFNDKRLILPAFTEEAAGLNVLSGTRWNDYRAVVCAGDKVLDFGPVNQMQRAGP